jgi:hypothetical protein
MSNDTLRPGDMKTVDVYAYCPVCGEPCIDKQDLHSHIGTFHTPVRQDFQFQKLTETVAELQRQLAELTRRLDAQEAGK